MTTSLVNADLLSLTAPDYLTEEQVIVHMRVAQAGTQCFATETNQFSYNHLGQIVQVTDAAGARTLGYNSYGEQETDSLLADGVTHLITENRDTYGRSIGNRTTSTEGADNTLYKANALNQYTSIQENEETSFLPQNNSWYIKFEIPGTMDGNFLLSIISRNKIMKQNNTREIAESCYAELVEMLDTQYIKIW